MVQLETERCGTYPSFYRHLLNVYVLVSSTSENNHTSLKRRNISKGPSNCKHIRYRTCQDERLVSMGCKEWGQEWTSAVYYTRGA